MQQQAHYRQHHQPDSKGPTLPYVTIQFSPNPKDYIDELEVNLQLEKYYFLKFNIQKPHIRLISGVRAPTFHFSVQFFRIQHSLHPYNPEGIYRTLDTALPCRN